MDGLPWLTEIAMRASGIKIRLTVDMACITMLMELDTTVSGKMTDRKGRVWKDGPMAASTEAHITVERNMGSVHSHGQMAHNMRENGC